MLAPVTTPRRVDVPDPAGRLRHLHRELSGLAAKLAAGQLGSKGVGRLSAILNETARHASHESGYRRVYDRALQIQKRALRPPRAKRRNGTGLSQGGREVLGGIAGSRRGH